MFEWKFMQIVLKMKKLNVNRYDYGMKMNPEYSERWPIICSMKFESHRDTYSNEWNGILIIYLFNNALFKSNWNCGGSAHYYL